jgi:hypothetical protein
MNEYLGTKSTVARTLIRVVDTRYSTESIFGNTFLGASRTTLRRSC